MNSPDLNNLPHPKTLSAGTRILYEESVFKKDGKKFAYYGKRQALVRVLSPGIPGSVVVEIVKCSGANAFPAGVKITKPVQNLLRGYLVESQETAPDTNLKEGGHIEGVKNGKKVVLGTADQGGMSVGAAHTDGGIKGEVGEGGNRIEFENKEPLIKPEAVNDNTVDTFEGKKMNSKEILSYINVENGGRSLYEDGGETGTNTNPIQVPPGSVILTAPVSSNPKKYDYNGKKMTGLEIASEINHRGGGVKFEKGGQSCGCTH